MKMPAELDKCNLNNGHFENDTKTRTLAMYLKAVSVCACAPGMHTCYICVCSKDCKLKFVKN